ncbi:ATP-grasp domain-containing protein [Carboxylicivirga sp. RSCT41]|uniref:ATP-grasp domain-containing protein n=1 Tax=Carboxylicivirga agarovorans TaxID=3417570 RepID=UPI003D348B3E
MNILFTSSGRRNYLLSYFKKEIGSEGKIVAADMDRSAVSLAIADVAYLVPCVYDDGYIDRILEICKSEDVKIVISLNDLELPILSANKGAFEKNGISLIVSDKEVIDLCFDKVATNVFASRFGCNTPKTYTTIKDVKEALNDGTLSFPLIIKPRWGSGSISMEIVENTNELDLAYRLLDSKLNRTSLSEISVTDRKEALLIQEVLMGDEYGLDIINDLNGSYQTTIVKKKLKMRAGETDKAQVVDRPDLMELGEVIAHELKHIGNLDCDVFDVDGKLFLLEMNPRFGGGYPFSHEAGANLPKAILEWVKGNEIDVNKLLMSLEERRFGKCDQMVELLK